MVKSNETVTTSTWRQDTLASIVVFLVAVPLCMGIALASGVPVAAGLVTGILGGMLVGILAGSPLQVSGPAAGLTVVCGEVIRQHGLPAFGLVVMIAGAIQLGAGLAKLGKWFRAVSPAVIHGMLSGIGLLILSGQLHVMMDDRPRENGIANLSAIPVSLWKGLGIPTWEAKEVRRERTTALRTWNSLFDKQRTHARLITRNVAKLKALDKDRGPIAKVDWKSLSAEQQTLTDETRVALDELRQSSLLNQPTVTGQSWTDVIAEAQRSQQALLTALNDESADAAGQAASQSIAGIGDLFAELKSHAWAGKIGLLAIAIIVFWPKFARGRLKLVPAALVAVASTTLLAWWLDSPVLYVNVPSNLWDGLRFPNAIPFDEVSYKGVFLAGLLVAVIASAESLLCAAAVDHMHNGPRTNYDRELAAQGIGNIACGLVGAIPMTGVIVRSAANVQAGGKTRLSAFLHGVWLLVFAALLAPVLNRVPVAALAGVLVVTGFKLIDYHGFLSMWKSRRAEALIFLATVVVIVVEDLLLGVVTGIVLSAIRLLLTFSYLHVTVETSRVDQEEEKTVLRLTGAATFLKLPVLAETLDRVPAGAELHADLEQLDFIDHACLELLASWAKRHESTGGKLILDWGQLHARLDAGRARTAVPG